MSLFPVENDHGRAEALGEILSVRGLGEPISSYRALRQRGTDQPF